MDNNYPYVGNPVWPDSSSYQPLPPDGAPMWMGVGDPNLQQYTTAFDANPNYYDNYPAQFHQPPNFLYPPNSNFPPDSNFPPNSNFAPTFQPDPYLAPPMPNYSVYDQSIPPPPLISPAFPTADYTMMDASNQYNSHLADPSFALPPPDLSATPIMADYTMAQSTPYADSIEYEVDYQMPAPSPYDQVTSQPPLYNSPPSSNTLNQSQSLYKDLLNNEAIKWQAENHNENIHSADYSFNDFGNDGQFDPMESQESMYNGSADFSSTADVVSSARPGPDPDSPRFKFKIEGSARFNPESITADTQPAIILFPGNNQDVEIDLVVAMAHYSTYPNLARRSIANFARHIICKIYENPNASPLVTAGVERSNKGLKLLPQTVVRTLSEFWMVHFTSSDEHHLEEVVGWIQVAIKNYLDKRRCHLKLTKS